MSTTREMAPRPGCEEVSAALTDLLRGQPAEVLLGTIQRLIARVCSVTPERVERALIEARRCREWRMADDAWVRYLDARNRRKAMDEPLDFVKWADNLHEQEVAYKRWMLHSDRARAMFEQPLTGNKPPDAALKPSPPGAPHA